MPWFAFFFLLVIILNSLLQGAAFIPQEGLAKLTQAINSFDKFKQAGAKPFLLAGILFIWLTVGGYFITKLIV